MINSKGFIGVIVLLILALLVTGGGFYIYQQQKINTILPIPELPANESVNNKIQTTTNTLETNKTQNQGGLKTDIHIKTDVTQMVDCGNETCFQQNFSSCQPATLNADAGLASTSYKIIGPKAGGCEVSFKYTKNPNPKWVNQEMTCTFDNKIDFQKSFENTFNGVIGGSVVCTGPLYAILRSI